MSGLARYFNHIGCIVCGYDKTPTDLTDNLRNEGIQVVFEDDRERIPKSFRDVDTGTLIIFTPAIPKDSDILNFFQKRGLRFYNAGFIPTEGDADRLVSADDNRLFFLILFDVDPFDPLKLSTEQTVD